MANINLAAKSSSHSPSRRRMSLSKKEAIQGATLVTPWALGFLIFSLGPMILSLLMGFTNYSITNQPKWLGLGNYTEALTHDKLFWPSLRRTAYYALVMVPASITGSLSLAVLLNQGLRGTNIYRVLFFIPSLTPGVAAVYLWKWLMDPSLGLINFVIWRLFHVEGPLWLSGKATVIPSLMIMALWGGIGGSTMLIFLAALQGVPEELYEAADIDGASSFAKLMNITVPMISPAIFFNLVLGIIAALKVFTSAFVSTQGGPARASWFYALHIYTQAFQYFNLGYACALSWIFFLIIICLSILQIRMSDRWVFYSGQRA